MKRRLVMLAGVFCMGSVLLTARTFGQRSSLNHPVVIEGGTLIDGTGREPLRDAAILIEGDRIKAVSQKGKLQYPAGAQIIHADGRTILPGLIDMHVHYDAWMAPLFLAHGVTSIVDLSAVEWTFAQRDGVDKGKITGPRIFTANPAFGGPLLPSFGHRRPEEPQIAEAAARKFVRAFLDRGIRVAKVYTEVTPEELTGIADEAHKAGVRVMGHLASLDARQAANLGIDGLAHSSGVALATIKDPDKVRELREIEAFGIAVDYPYYLLYHAFMDSGAVEEIVQLLVRRNVRIEPDLINVARWTAGRRRQYQAEDLQLLKDTRLSFIPENVRQRISYWAPLEVLSPEEVARLQQGYSNLQQFISRFVAAGGTVLAGSDPAFVIPGLALHRELQLLVEAGLTPMQALLAATRNNAEFLGKDGEVGTIEEGKRADVVIIRGDPLREIRNTEKVDLVIQNGKVVNTAYRQSPPNPIPRPSRAPFVHPVPAIRSIAPETVIEGEGDLTVQLEGENFLATSRVLFNGNPVQSQVVLESQVTGTAYLPHFRRLRATIPARQLRRVGNFPITAVNPPPEGGASSPAYLIVAFR